MQQACDQAKDQGQVRRRRVFFVPGYDPVGSRRYRELYRTQSDAQSTISGYSIHMQGRPGSKAFAWDVCADIEGAQTETQYEVLSWGEVVRESMDHSIAQTYFLLLRTLWVYVSSGALWQLLRLRPTAMIAALYPAFMLIAQLLIGLALWGAAAWAVGGWLGVIACAPLVWVTLEVFRHYDGFFYVYYLMHDYAFSAQFMGRTPPELETQMDAFSTRIQSALKSDVDEVLIVGHSSGAHLAVTLLADLLRRNAKMRKTPVLSLLTLGQVIPMISFLPDAGKLRRDLNMLSRSEAIAWIDVSAPGDGGSFALCDPVHVSGVAPPPCEKRWPKVLSAKFSLTLSEELLRSTRWRFFRRHIQYLCAFDRPQEYDYFRITAGPQTLENRFAWRGATQSREETPLSPYRSF